MWGFKQIKFHYEKSRDVFTIIAAIYNKMKVAAIRFTYIILNFEKQLQNLQ
jgi:hypothetical protein